MSAYHGKLKTGTYTLNTSMTAKDMMVVMAAESEESTEAQRAQNKEQIWIHRTEHLRMIPGRIMPEKKTRIQMRMNRQEQSSDSRERLVTISIHLIQETPSI